MQRLRASCPGIVALVSEMRRICGQCLSSERSRRSGGGGQASTETGDRFGLPLCPTGKGRIIAYSKGGRADGLSPFAQ